MNETMFALGLCWLHLAMLHLPMTLSLIGPYVLFKGGTEAALETHLRKTGEKKAFEASLELIYGITGDKAGVQIPMYNNFNGSQDKSDF